LTELLFEHTGFYEEDYEGAIEDHFTIVTLEGLLQEYRAQLSDIGELQTYLLNTIPIAFPNRAYGVKVNKWLREHVSLNPVQLELRIGKEPTAIIEQPLAEGISEPVFQILTDVQNRKLAFIWYCLTTKGERIATPEGVDEGSGTSGFLLKLKGFTLGDRTRLKPLWPPVGGRTLYHHYTGEIHILDDAEVSPNAARNDLEPSESKSLLTRYLSDQFDQLSKRADPSRNIVNTQKRLKGFVALINNLTARMGSPDENVYELYRESKNYLEELEKLEKDLTRLTSGRGRKKVMPTESQSQQIKNMGSDKQHEAFSDECATKHFETNGGTWS